MTHYWYPLVYSEDVTSHSIHATKLFGEPLVLYRDVNNRVVCALDVCPHRSAPLSLGKISQKGVLECMYHGWQYGESGKCAKIPSLKENSSFHNYVCLRTKLVHEEGGLVWVWAGPKELANAQTQIPRFLFKEYEQNGWTSQEGKRYSVPFDYGLMMDNLMDVAHLDFVHHGTLGNRKNAGHIKMEECESIYKMQCHPQSRTFLVTKKGNANLKASFVPPCFVRTDVDFSKDGSRKFSQFFICIPTDKNEMRLIYIFFRNFISNPLLLTLISPFDFIMDWLSEKIVDQDLELLTNLSINIQQHNAPVLGYVNVSADQAIRSFRDFKNKCDQNYDPYFKGWNKKTARKQHKHQNQSDDHNQEDVLEDIEDLF